MKIKKIIEAVKDKNPVLITEVMETAKFTYGQIQKVLQNLLEENVSIRDIITILETLANYAAISKDPRDLTEKVREALGLQICLQYADPSDHKLRVIQLSEGFTTLLQSNAVYPPDGSKPQVALDPVDRRKWIGSVSECLARVTEKGYQPIILCTQPVRPLVKSSTEREMPGIIVLSDMEALAAGKHVMIEVIDKIDDKDEVI